VAFKTLLSKFLVVDMVRLFKVGSTVNGIGVDADAEAKLVEPAEIDEGRKE
jgi:hypothetical protein